ncbi:WecB/TagA/CpsF family glycosyltransferase [Pseudorhodoplanes sp.]|uniref:WecB/TagA/CpsF family glycosyltransferase n=1 Tax=Pseudorhodoplanes sp. TaxID=1934341 RepID=UPI002B63F27C|nr:WecB/TagA/CpsF family glycosyltransferase [Pseudorhodoplanes sp.]HWV41603.1 WecB/TagA/CpsF family glycosyltransferase [Pseudorhodoplanes sp.]
MQITHVVRQFHPAVGGMESVVWELACAQIKKGHSVRVVTLDRVFKSPRRERLPHRETFHDIEIVRIPFFGSPRYPLAFGVLKSVKGADIVHVHGVDFFFDFLACTWPLHRRRLVLSTHGGYFHTRFASSFKKLYFATVTRLMLSRYAGVASVSTTDQALFRTIRSRGVTLIENGVSLSRFTDTASRAPAKTIVSLGRFSHNKRLDRLIAFVAALARRDPGWRLKILGRPSDLTAADLRRMAADAGIADATEVVCLPSERNIRRIFGECSVIASASSYEGFGLTAVEGLSAGLFPVLNEIPPFRHLVERHRLGLIVDFSDAEAAAARFLAKWRDIVIDYEGHRRRAIDASVRYDWAGVSRQYEAFYNSALGGKVRSILDVGVGVSTFNDAARLLDRRFEDGKPAAVVFASAHTLNTTVANDEVRTALRKSIVFNDGIGVDIASRLLFGKWFPENLNGTDFVPDYLRHTRHRYRIFFLGARPGIAERAAARLLEASPRHELAGCYHGYLGDADTADITARIRESRADLLLVAMGNPGQELWLMNHLAETGCHFGFAVGGLFDFMAGAVPRAPQWARTLRMEWLYRVAQEPRRLGSRYFIGMPLFLLRVGRQWLAGPRIPNTVSE